MEWLKKAAPVWLVMVLIVALIGVSVAWAATALTTKTYTAAGGEKVILSEELTMAEVGMMVVPSGVEGAAVLTGTFTDADITLRGNAIADTDYVFKCDLAEIATTPASKAYTVSLYQDGTLVGNALTVTSDLDDTTAATGHALCYWSIGAEITAAVYYVEVVPA